MSEVVVPPKEAEAPSAATEVEAPGARTVSPTTTVKPTSAPGASGQQVQMDIESHREAEVHGKYVRLQNINSDDESADYVLEDVSRKTQPISYATAFNVGRNRPPIDYYWLAVVALIVQAVLAPYLYLFELGWGLHLAYRSLLSCRMSRSYFARGEYELAALMGFKSGRYAGGSLVLSILITGLATAAVLAICLGRPEGESTLEFSLLYKGSS